MRRLSTSVLITSITAPGGHAAGRPRPRGRPANWIPSSTTTGQTAFIHGATGYAVAIDKRAADPRGGLHAHPATDIALARFLPNGKPDPAFGGGDGRTEEPGRHRLRLRRRHPGTARSWWRASATCTNHSQFAVVRFGIRGVPRHSPSAATARPSSTSGRRYQGANAVAVGAERQDPRGRLHLERHAEPVGAGPLTSERDVRPALRQRRQGAHGPEPHEREQIEDLAVSPGGIITAAGSAETTLAAVRGGAVPDRAGRSDTTFGNGGKNVIDVSVGGDIAYGLARQPDGKFVVVGYASHGRRATGASSGSGPRAARHRLRQRRQGHHRVRAHLTSTPTAWWCSPTAGSSWWDEPPAGGPDFCVVRYKPGGEPRPTFGGDGKVLHRLRPRDDTARGVAIQTNGKIVVAGEPPDGQRVAPDRRRPIPDHLVAARAIGQLKSEPSAVDSPRLRVWDNRPHGV